MSKKSHCNNILLITFDKILVYFHCALFAYGWLRDFFFRDLVRSHMSKHPHSFDREMMKHRDKNAVFLIDWIKAIAVDIEDVVTRQNAKMLYH